MNAINTNGIAREGTQTWAALLELATREVFCMMLGADLAPGTETKAEENLEITSMVGLAGELSGIVTLRCTVESATVIAAKMLDVEVKQARSKMSDAVGEVCNMIAGNFKNKITGMGDSCLLSVPTVITDIDYTLSSPSSLGKIEVHFLFEGNLLVVSLEVNS